MYVFFIYLLICSFSLTFQIILILLYTLIGQADDDGQTDEHCLAGCGPCEEAGMCMYYATNVFVWSQCSVHV